MCFSFNFWADLTCCLLAQVYIIVVVPSFIHHNIDIGEAPRTSALGALWTIVSCALAYFITSWLGLASSNMDVCDAELLHNMREGVLVFSENGEDLLFQNSTAQQLSETFQTTLGASLIENDGGSVMRC